MRIPERLPPIPMTAVITEHGSAPPELEGDRPQRGDSKLPSPDGWIEPEGPSESDRKALQSVSNLLAKHGALIGQICGKQIVAELSSYCGSADRPRESYFHTSPSLKRFAESLR